MSTRWGKRWGKKRWVVRFWLLKMQNPFPEPYSIRQAFYTELPNIVQYINKVAPHVLTYPNWARDFHQSMISILSDLVLEGKASYRQINILDDSGASNIIWQELRPCLKIGDSYEVDHPIEVWVENNATFNCLRPLFEDTQKIEGLNIFPKLNLLSQRGFAKTQHVEKMMLDRQNDVKVILNLTDFDPSGYKMPRDLEKRLKQIGLNIEVKHIGILPNQIPAQRRVASLISYNKRDPRCKEFMKTFPNDPQVQKGFGYEIQALNPKEIRNLVKDAINKTIQKYSF